MKKLLILTLVAAGVAVLTNCSSAKKATAATAPATTYEHNIQTMVMSNCSPCHIPAKGGNKKPYDNYANVKSDIDEIIRRIELNRGDKGFMPFKRAKLADSTVAVFKEFKTDGMLEK